ncbi:hypothetical protein RI367_001208 [Sorochytrium milnesiophthora]
MSDSALLTHPLPQAFFAHFPSVVDRAQQLELLQWALVVALEAFVADVRIDPAHSDVAAVQQAVLAWVAKRNEANANSEHRIQAYLAQKEKYFPDPYQVYPVWWGNREFVPGYGESASPAAKLLQKWRLSSALIDRAARDVERQRNNRQLYEREAAVSWVPKKVVDEFTQTELMPQPVPMSPPLSGKLPAPSSPSKAPPSTVGGRLQYLHELQQQRKRARAQAATAAPEAFFVSIAPEPAAKPSTGKKSRASAPETFTIPQDEYTAPRLALRQEKIKTMLDIAKNVLQQDDFVGCFDEQDHHLDDADGSAQEQERSPDHVSGHPGRLWFQKDWLSQTVLDDDDQIPNAPKEQGDHHPS